MHSAFTVFEFVWHFLSDDPQPVIEFPLDKISLSFSFECQVGAEYNKLSHDVLNGYYTNVFVIQ